MLRAAASWQGSRYSLLDLLRESNISDRLGNRNSIDYVSVEGLVGLLLELPLRVLIPRIILLLLVIILGRHLKKPFPSRQRKPDRTACQVST